VAADSSTFRLVVESIAAHRLRVSIHALREAEDDRLTLVEIEAATSSGECVEDYPDDARGASCLVLGFLPDRAPIHALWGFDEPSRHAILITVYRPDPQRWSQDFRKRRPRDVGDAE
jgi:hypothetical protein